ncbi:MAG TPA: hypothetical protein VLT91_11855, partial [Rhizomicrobium sp.]|nr:hypothetical protein [Rhizomicrobium sp.]
MNAPPLPFRPDRHPAATYEQILERDTRAIPDFLREKNVPDLGTDPVPASRYYDHGYFQKEVDRVWSRVWQMACREEEIAKVGDYQIYEI